MSSQKNYCIMNAPLSNLVSLVWFFPVFQNIASVTNLIKRQGEVLREVREADEVIFFLSSFTVSNTRAKSALSNVVSLGGLPASEMSSSFWTPLTLKAARSEAVQRMAERMEEILKQWRSYSWGLDVRPSTITTRRKMDKLNPAKKEGKISKYKVEKYFWEQIPTDASGWCRNGSTRSRTITEEDKWRVEKNPTNVQMEIPVLVGLLKSSILRSTSFQWLNTFWGVGVAVVEQPRHKAIMVAQGAGKFGLGTFFFLGLEGFWGQPQGPNFPSPKATVHLCTRHSSAQQHKSSSSIVTTIYFCYLTSSWEFPQA